MHYDDNIDTDLKRKDMQNVVMLFEYAKKHQINGQTQKSEIYFEKIIEICDRYPKNEDMLFFKIKSLKNMKRTYKAIECIEQLLQVNPYNTYAINEIAKILN